MTSNSHIIMSPKSNPLYESGVVLAAITALLYCIGTAKFSGYTNTLGLNDNILDRNFQQVLYQGFLDSFLQLFVALMSYSAYRFFYSDVILPDVESWLKHSRQRKKRYIKFKHWWNGKRKDSVVVQNAKRHTRIFFKITFALLALFLSLAYFEFQGRDAANVVIKELKDASHIPNIRFISVRMDEKPMKLYFLGCGDRNCAGIDVSTKIIYYFPQNNITYHLPSDENKPAKDQQKQENIKQKKDH